MGLPYDRERKKPNHNTIQDGYADKSNWATNGNDTEGISQGDNGVKVEWRVAES